MKKLLISTALLLAAPSAVAATHINADTFDAVWPFTVQRGTLECHYAVTFKADGVVYALNGPAKDQGHAELDPIGLDDLEFLKFAESLRGPGETLEDVLAVTGRGNSYVWRTIKKQRRP